MLWSTMLPPRTQKGHKIWHENIQWYVSNFFNAYVIIIIIIYFFFLSGTSFLQLF